mmetsp:Transcript_40684/g.62061  ORF Transcript_40684/g.62061 Transcript_40684/m.62061 type:complete len:189 (+) Transcript_40684:1237-1803(+)
MVRLMSYLEIDDPIEAVHVHGACGLLGCISVAFFKKDVGIFYGAEGSLKLLLIQVMGCSCIAMWSAGLTALFFFVSKKITTVRMPVKAEILGGDIHYFYPIVFEGDVNEYDTGLMVNEMIQVNNSVVLNSPGFLSPVSRHSSRIEQFSAASRKESKLARGEQSGKSKFFNPDVSNNDSSISVDAPFPP